MDREVVLRRALEAARDRRERELEAVQERTRVVRRRLRELTDRLVALDTVQRQLPAQPSGRPSTPGEGKTPAVMPAPDPSFETVPLSPPPVPWHERIRDRLFAALSDRHPEGFTVGQLREVLDEVDEARPHSYDAAWSLANTLVRTRALDVAGTRPGPKMPVRVFRIRGGEMGREASTGMA